MGWSSGGDEIRSETTAKACSTCRPADAGGQAESAFDELELMKRAGAAAGELVGALTAEEYARRRTGHRWRSYGRTCRKAAKGRRPKSVMNRVARWQGPLLELGSGRLQHPAAEQAAISQV